MKSVSYISKGGWYRATTTFTSAGEAEALLFAYPQNIEILLESGYIIGRNNAGTPYCYVPKGVEIKCGCGGGVAGRISSYVLSAIEQNE